MLHSYPVDCFVSSEDRVYLHHNHGRLYNCYHHDDLQRLISLMLHFYPVDCSVHEQGSPRH